MTNKMYKARVRRGWYCGGRYYAVMGVLALMVPLSLIALSLALPLAQAEGNWDVEGANGMLYVHGVLTESACRLEMESARQDVSLGEIGTGRLQRAGDRGAPVTIQLRLADCLRTPAANLDVRTSTMTWSSNQPAMSVSFQSTRDTDNPQLIKAQGVSGLGLRMEDGAGRDVHLGERGKPLLLTPGQNTLTYTVSPERTPASLVAGTYQARVDFHLSYD